MAWTTWMPLMGLVLAPLTRSLGPVVSLNIFLLLALPLSAWSSFVLYRYVTGSWWAATAGGYLFGFSGYMLYRLWEGDPQLILVFPVTLSVWLTLRALNNEFSSRAFIGTLAGMLIIEFLISLEVFATATLVGAITFCFGFFLSSNATRRRLRALLLPLLVGYAIAMLTVSPYLYFFFSSAVSKTPMWQPFLFSADLLFFILPSWVSVLGQLTFFQRIYEIMPGSVIYVGFSYLGPVLFAVIAIFGWRKRRDVRVKLLLWIMVITAVLSFGPWLYIGGHRVVPMPGALLTHLPLLRNALPVWFSMYLGLAAALIVSLWLSSSRITRGSRCAVVVAAVLFGMPRLSPAFWDTRVDTPRFFLNGAYRGFLKPGEIVLPVPYGWHGNSLMWQAQTDMYFRMAGAWTGPPPAEFERWPAMVALFNGRYLPDAEIQVKAFMAAHQITAVLVDASIENSRDPVQREEYRTIISALGSPSVESGGVLIYRCTSAQLKPWRNLNPTDLERRVDEERFGALLKATNRYLEAGGDVVRLTTARLMESGLIRGDWLGGPSIRISDGLWVEPSRDGTVDLGTFGSRGALAALKSAYKRNAMKITETSIATPENPGGDAQLELIVMTFDRAGLERAARQAKTSATFASSPEAALGRRIGSSGTH
jgi:hypothetical protein